jgi:hypothetical protein
MYFRTISPIEKWSCNDGNHENHNGGTDKNPEPWEGTWKLLDSVVDPMANWSQLAFPRMLAPAAFSFITHVAS